MITMLCMLTAVSAIQNLCVHGEVKFNTTCVMVTPILNCTSYTYEITNLTGTLVKSGTLTLHKNISKTIGALYRFDFHLPDGDYIINLCDGTYREVFGIQEDDHMIIAMIILLPMLFGFFLLIAAATLSPTKHPALKIFAFLLSFPLFFVSMRYGTAAVAEYYGFNELIDSMSTTVFWTAIAFSVLLMYFLIYLLTLFFHDVAQKRKEALEY